MFTPPADRPLRWGVLSTANIGRAAVNPAIQSAPDNDLVAVASRDETRARAFADEHGIARAYGTYQELVDDPEIDVLYNPLPNSLHRDWTLRALRAGKHVLCEKPLGLNEGECLEMAEAAETAGVRLMEAFMYRFHPRTEQLLEWMKTGRIGRIRLIQAAFTFRLTRPGNIRMDPALGGGALMDVGCYCVNVSRSLLGEEPSSVQASARWADSGVDAGLTGTLHFPSGAVAQIACALDVERLERVVVAGEDAWLEVPKAFLPGVADAEIIETAGRSDPVRHVVPGADEYECMVRHFAECVRQGTPPRYDAREAARTMRVIDALYASARTGGVTQPL